MKEFKKKLNIAIAGLGFGKKVHLKALQDSSLLNPTHLYHYDGSKKELIESETGLKFYSNWKELVSNKSIDGIIIASPPEFRFELAKEALEHKKHLLLEKPVAINSLEIKELQRLALIYNLSVCVDFEYRAVPLFMQTKKYIDDGALGNIYLARLDWIMGSRSDPNREWDWYSSSEKGGGVIGALGTHAFDMLHWFLGEPINVSAKIATSIPKRPKVNSKRLFDVTSEDVCLANIDIKNYSNENIPCQICLSSVSKNGRGFNLEIYGSNGSLCLKSENQTDYVHGFSLNVTNYLDKSFCLSADQEFKFEKSWSDGRIAPVKRIHNWWAESIKKRTPIIPGLNEGLLSQRVCESIRKSSQTGISVEIE